MRNTQAVTFLAVGLLLLPRPMPAHHGTSAYDTTKLTTVKGTVTEYKFINPHVEISVEAKDENGKVETWTGEANSPNVLSRNGWSRDIIKPGDQITLVGNPAKSGAHVLRLQKVVLSSGRELDPNALND